MIFRFANYLMTALFVLAVIVQYNDPNPLRWMLIYGAAGLVCLLFALNKLNWTIATAVVFISGVWAILKIPQLTTSGFRHMFEEISMLTPGVEAAREFLGLMIVFTWITAVAVAAYQKKKGTVFPVSE